MDDGWSWEMFPNSLIYSPYLAGTKESRLACVWNHDSELGWIWDIALGGRVGLLRFGDHGSPRPCGWQLDLEGAAFPRLDLEHHEDLVAADFRAGTALTYGCKRFQAKFGFYHLSSHLGDEFQLRFPEVSRINYSRNALVLGGSYYLTDDVRLYGEAEWAPDTDGGSEPWELHFGAEYSPVKAIGSWSGSPFAAVNATLREEVDWGGQLVVQAGWQWRSRSNHRFRAGAQYFAGKSEQFEFLHRNEDKIGMGIWFDL